MARVTNVRVTIGPQQVATAAYGEIGLPNEHKLTLHQTNWQESFKDTLKYLQQQCHISASGPQGTAYNADFRITGIKGDTVHLD